MFSRILFSTTVMASAALVAVSAHAGGMEHNPAPVRTPTPVGVNIGGFIDFQAGLTDQDSAYETGPNSRDVKFQNDTEVHISVDGKADNGLGYGAVIELEADVTADSDAEGLNADKTYLYVEGGFGRVEMGNNSGAEDALKLTSANIARATGGTDGDWDEYVNVTGLGAPFIINPDLPLDHANGTSEDATKLTYYTPRFAGVQAGISYTPDSGNGGTAAGFTTDMDAGQFENVFGLGANYERDVEGVGLMASLSGSFGESETAAFEDLAAWAAGLGASYQGFTVVASYGDWGDSGLAVGTVDDDQNFWDAGVAYETGPYGVSATYMQSEASGNDFDIVSLGADYQLAPGLTPYVEVNFFELDAAATAVDNDGSNVLVGTQLNF